MGPIAPDSPQQAGEFWVLPSLDDVSGGVVRMHVAIAGGDAADLQDTDVQVEVLVDGRSLELLDGPVSGPLPAIELIGVNAYARYVFDNPGDPVPSTVQVTVRGGATTFEISIPIV